MLNLPFGVDLGHNDRSRFQHVIAIIRPEISYSVMPSTLLEMLGIDPQWTESLQRADGSQQEYSLADVKIKIDDQQRTTVCVFGKVDSQPALGKHILDGFGMTVDEAASKLVPVRLVFD